jgi:hypothetical protein
MTIPQKYELFVILKGVEFKVGRNSTSFMAQKISQRGGRRWEERPSPEGVCRVRRKKAKLYVRLIKQRGMKTCGGGDKAPRILNIRGSRYRSNFTLFRVQISVVFQKWKISKKLDKMR